VTENLSDISKKRILFYRDFTAFSGGHLKVRDYFNHLELMPEFIPSIYFSPNTLFDQNNPWLSDQDKFQSYWTLENVDYLFLAGLDWLILDEHQRECPPIPVINLIQHVRHANPRDQRYQFLSCPAVRICVSQEVADAIRNTGRVNGPIYVIPCGIDFDLLPTPNRYNDKENTVLVAGLKNPSLALSVASHLEASGLPTRVLTEPLPRNDYLREVDKHKLVVLLPDTTEGFYLPALEAMWLGSLVICPDAVGNRSFCTHKVNCYRPDNEANAIVNDVIHANNLGTVERNSILALAHDTVLRHSIQLERERFQRIMALLLTHNEGLIGQE